MNNPFHSPTARNIHLTVEQCQRIFYVAARTGDAQPDRSILFLADRRRRAHIAGSEAYILHPQECRVLFRGITLSVYRAVRELFCTALFRNEETVWEIVADWANEAHLEVPTREAIWALCGYLRKDRDERFLPNITSTHATWGIIPIQLQVQLHDPVDTCPTFLCVVSDIPARVVAFQYIHSEMAYDDVMAQVLYTACIDQRIPEALSSSGLHWYLPAQIVSSQPVPTHVQHCCDMFGLPISIAPFRFPLLDDVCGSWTQAYVGRTFMRDHFEAIFDNYLEKRHGYGPRKVRADMAYAYRHVQGYNRNPAYFVAALRSLLPCTPTTVSDDGTCIVAGHTYRDPLLSYRRGANVDLRIAYDDPSQAFVYDTNRIVCLAQEVWEPHDSEDGEYMANSAN